MAVRVRHRRGYPVAGLTFDTSGNLYGAGAGGGANGTGVVFEYRRNRMVGRTRSRYSFGKYPASGDGFAPNSLLVFDRNGNMYGITNEGGGDTGCFNGCGAAFCFNDPLLTSLRSWSSPRLTLRRNCSRGHASTWTMSSNVMLPSLGFIPQNGITKF